jgi:bacteriorhodopsin
MADIDIVKKGSNTWLWIVLVLAAVALIFWFAVGRNHAPQTGFNIDNGFESISAAIVATT